MRGKSEKMREGNGGKMVGNGQENVGNTRKNFGLEMRRKCGKNDGKREKTWEKPVLLPVHP